MNISKDLNSFEQKHPYPPFIPDKAEKLILGSFPPVRLCNNQLIDGDIPFYYGSRNNTFWKIIQIIYNTELYSSSSDPETRVNMIKSFLSIKHIAVVDIFSKITRKNNRSSDNDLIPIEFTDLHNLLDQNSTIKSIFCTSCYVFKKLKDYLTNYQGESYAIKKIYSDIFMLFYLKRVILCHVLISPSPQANRNLFRNLEYINKLNENPNYTLTQFRVDKYKEHLNPSI